MGKTKKVRNRNAGPSPIGLPSTLTTNNNNQNPQVTLNELKDGHSIPITNKLDSDISDDREIACCSLANMVVEDSSVIKLIIDKGILPKVIQKICDPDHHVSIAAAGCIRNISIVGGSDICKLLVDNDCLMPITNALLKEGGIPDKLKNEKYLIQLISVLWNLCENVDHATEIVTNTRVLPNLVNLLRPNIYNTELMLNTAQLINVITDANDAIKSQFSEDAVNLMKATMANGKNPNLLRVLCASILFNLSPNEHVPSLLKMTLPIINICLDFEPQTAVIQTIQPHLKALQVQDATLERPSREVQVLIHTQKNEIDALTVSMEILTNVCTDSGDETLGEFIELDDNYDENGMNADINMSSSGSINPEIPNLIMSSGVCNKVIMRSAPLSKDLERLLLSAPALEPILTSYLLTQSRALNCLNNIMLIFDSQGLVLGDMSPVWNTMGQLCAHILNMRTMLKQPISQAKNNTNLFGVPQDEQQTPAVKSEEERIMERAKKLIHIEDLDDNLRDVTAIMWTVLRKNKEKPHFTPALDQVESVYNLARIVELNEETRANALGMLGVLGTMPQYSSIIKNLGMLFLDTLNERPLSGWIVAESLNSIFDVFADLYNDVVSELQILQRLQQFLPVLKDMIQQHKKTMDRLLLDRLDEAKVNLPRFLSYKRKQICSEMDPEKTANTNFWLCPMRCFELFLNQTKQHNSNMSDDGNIGDYWRDVKDYRRENGISSSGNKYYAVAEGKNPGIYSSWDQASQQVNGYSGAKHHGFRTSGEAKAYMQGAGKAPQFK